MENRVHIGTIVRAHSLNGELRVELRESLSLYPSTTVWVGYSSLYSKPYILESFRTVHRAAIIRLKGITTRPAAELLREQGIFVEPSAIQNHHALHAHLLLGHQVRTTSGEILGTITAVEQSPAHPILHITAQDGAELLLPYVEAFIVSHDDTSSALVVSPPEGLLQIYQPPNSLQPKKRRG
ncbi:MAG: ribosome maturation factor RimM [Chlorobi bacterium]|nr:ribosome maturation factor RimM [Chlorobiota bacterium]